MLRCSIVHFTERTQTCTTRRSRCSTTHSQWKDISPTDSPAMYAQPVRTFLGFFAVYLKKEPCTTLQMSWRFGISTSGRTIAKPFRATWTESSRTTHPTDTPGAESMNRSYRKCMRRLIKEREIVGNFIPSLGGSCSWDSERNLSRHWRAQNRGISLLARHYFDSSLGFGSVSPWQFDK